MKKWTKGLIVSQIAELDVKNHNAVQLKNPSLLAAAYRHFGSWGRAIEEAGFDYNDVTLKSYKNKDLTKDELKYKIRSLNSISPKEVPYDIYSCARRFFGSWANALKECGISYNCRNKKSKEDILDEIRNLSYKLNIKKTNPALYYQAIRRFGTWPEAINASGIEYKSIKSIYNIWDHDKVIEAILKLNHKNSGYVMKNNNDVFAAGIKYFGSWENAIEASGIDYGTIKKSYSAEDELFDILCCIFGVIERHKTFAWLRYKNKMHLDFYIPGLKLAIERQGKQHYEPIDFAGRGIVWAKDQFAQIQARDKKKRNLLRRHGVKLIEIRYDDPHSVDFVKKQLKKRGLRYE